MNHLLEIADTDITALNDTELRKLIGLLCEATLKLLFADALVFDEETSTVKNIMSSVTTDSPSIYHFSCHGYFNGFEPLLSGLLLKVLLSVEEILYKLNFQNLPLICLSACRTFHSQITVGDELTGLSEAFLQAGAHAVIGSLWLVDDRSTSLLFKSFYQSVLSGLNTRLALRQSMNHLRNQPEFQSAYYWGAFRITGYPL